MRFWITKNGEVSIREQLVRQVLLGILSEDLPPGHKLPSVRALARRHQIHSNTVSSAYHDLLERGWLELRRGSGLFVSPRRGSADGAGDLDRMLSGLLQTAQTQGYAPEEVLGRLQHLVRPRRYQQIVVAEGDAAMREILVAELTERLSVPVCGIERTESMQASDLGISLVVALATRVAKVGGPCLALRLRSVRESLEGQAKPAANGVISIVSRSEEIRQWSRAMLISVGLEPECICEVDSSIAGWQERLGLSALLICDVVTERELPDGCHKKVHRILADSTIVELKQMCAG